MALVLSIVISLVVGVIVGWFLHVWFGPKPAAGTPVAATPTAESAATPTADSAVAPAAEPTASPTEPADEKADDVVAAADVEEEVVVIDEVIAIVDPVEDTVVVEEIVTVIATEPERSPEAVAAPESAIEDVTETAVIKPATAEDVTETAVINSPVAEDVTETAVIKPAATQDVTETAVIKPATEDVTETAVIKPAAEDVSETVVIEPSATEDVTETAVIKPAVVEDVTETAVIEPATEPAPFAETAPVAESEPAVAVAEETEPLDPEVEAEVAIVIPAQPGPAKIDAVDNLQRIEGIGPKMMKALNAAGISTFEQLAASDETTLRAAIAAAGMRFSPLLVTWPAKAQSLADAQHPGALNGKLVSDQAAN